MLTMLAGKKFFGEFDLSEAYTQFKVSAESRKYLAFTWLGQQYVFVGCPYGLRHIPSLFQRFMANLFADLKFVYPYIDNLPFASSTKEEHHEHARLIIERLNSVGIRIKPSSINLCNSEIIILGHLIDSRGIHLDPSKVQEVSEWPLPRTGKMLGTALGLFTFLRTHIRHHSCITESLEALKKQDVIEWTKKSIMEWDAIKYAIAHAPFLKYPDLNNPLALAVDTSRTGIGGILYEKKKLVDKEEWDDEIYHDNIISIVSKKLNECQRRYPTYKQELWGLVFCLCRFHTWIWGHPDVTVFVDHRPLVYLYPENARSSVMA